MTEHYLGTIFDPNDPDTTCYTIASVNDSLLSIDHFWLADGARADGHGTDFTPREVEQLRLVTESFKAMVASPQYADEIADLCAARLDGESDLIADRAVALALKVLGSVA